MGEKLNGKEILALVKRLDSLVDLHLSREKLGLRRAAVPGSLVLSDFEWTLFSEAFEPSKAYNASLLKDPGRILSYLQEKVGYERLHTGQMVTVTFRQHHSDSLVSFLDGQRGTVASVDEHGNPWVQFNPRNWMQAIERSRQKAASDASPFEATDLPNIDPKKRTLLVNALDTREYRRALRRHHLTPSFAAVYMTVADNHYDPLIDGLHDVTKEQLLYVLRNMDSLVPELTRRDEKEAEPDDVPLAPKSEQEDERPIGENVEAAFEAKKNVIAVQLQLVQKKVEKKTRRKLDKKGNELPSAGRPPAQIIAPGNSRRQKIWAEMFADPKKTDVLKKAAKKGGAKYAWAVALAIFINKCLKVNLMPFKNWGSKEVKDWKMRQNKRLDAARQKAQQKLRAKQKALRRAA